MFLRGLKPTEVARSSTVVGSSWLAVVIVQTYTIHKDTITFYFACTVSNQ